MIVRRFAVKFVGAALGDRVEEPNPRVLGCLVYGNGLDFLD